MSLWIAPHAVAVPAALRLFNHCDVLIGQPDRAAERSQANVAVGLIGERTSHALRCTYAQDCFDYYLAATGSQREASAFTSMSLGHGDGRSTYVSRVYLRNLAQAVV